MSTVFSPNLSSSENDMTHCLLCVLQEFTSARYVRLRLQKIRTLNADLMSFMHAKLKDIDPSVTNRVRRHPFPSVSGAQSFFSKTLANIRVITVNQTLCPMETARSEALQAHRCLKQLFRHCNIHAKYSPRAKQYIPKFRAVVIK